MRAAGKSGIALSVRVDNAGPAEHTVSLVAPAIGPYRLADDPEQAWYWYPKRGAAFDSRPCSYRERYSGLQAKPGVALYSEETPVDVTTQYQDGSFTYAMSTASTTPSSVPLNTVRFALPDFKTIEILYCDKPTGSWATGVRWVFFNGEAI